MDSQNFKTKILDNTLAQIKKQYGKGAIMRLGEETGLKVEVIPTGSLMLDMALGIRGIPRGRVTEIFGPESSGKTTIGLHIIAEAQKQGGVAAFIDAEHALDPTYAKKLGVNTDELLVSQPDYGEQALEIMEMLVRSNVVDVIVVDSIAALVPRAELEGDMGEAHMGLQARLMSQAMRKLVGAISKSKTVAIFINQIRMKMSPYGNPEVTTGGQAIKFYSSIRLEVRIKEKLKVGETHIGNLVVVKVAKNKLAPPFKSAELEILYGEGFSKESELINLGEAYEIITKSGAWYSMGEVKLGQGKENVKTILKENKEIRDKLEKAILEKLNEQPVGNSGRDI